MILLKVAACSVRYLATLYSCVPCAGLPFHPSYSLLESCQVNTLLSRISVECVYPSDSIVIGFQMIILQNLTNHFHANKTTDRQTPVSVLVEGDGLYQVIIFAIRGGRGIVGTNVEYMEMVMVGDVVPTTTTTTTTAAISTLGKLYGSVRLQLLTKLFNQAFLFLPKPRS